MESILLLRNWAALPSLRYSILACPNSWMSWCSYWGRCSAHTNYQHPYSALQRKHLHTKSCYCSANLRWCRAWHAGLRPETVWWNIIRRWAPRKGGMHSRGVTGNSAQIASVKERGWRPPPLYSSQSGKELSLEELPCVILGFRPDTLVQNQPWKLTLGLAFSCTGDKMKGEMSIALNIWRCSVEGSNPQGMCHNSLAGDANSINYPVLSGQN